MSHSRKLVLGFLLLVGVSIVFFKPSDEKQIRAVLTELERYASFEKPALPIENLQTARKIADRFADKISFHVDLEDGSEAIGARSRQELQTKAISVLTQLSRFLLRLEVLELRVQPRQASSRIKWRALGALPGADGEFLEQHEAELEFVKENNVWLISEVRATQVPR